MSDIVSHVSRSVGWDLFMDMAHAWKEGTLGGWRAREQLACQIPNFLETFRAEQTLEPVLCMIRDALSDPFATVREGAVQGVSRDLIQELMTGAENV